MVVSDSHQRNLCSLLSALKRFSGIVGGGGENYGSKVGSARKAKGQGASLVATKPMICLEDGPFAKNLTIPLKQDSFDLFHCLLVLRK